MAIDFIGDGLPVVLKGDIASSDGTASVSIPVGTSSQILTARSSTSSGLAWETAGTPAVPKWEAIAYSYISSSIYTVTFSSISQNYQDLVLLFMLRGTNSLNQEYFNVSSSNVTGASSFAYLKFQWYSATSGPTFGINEYPTVPTTANNFELPYVMNQSTSPHWTVGSVKIMNYSNTASWKPIISRTGSAGYSANTNSYTGANFGEIRSNNAISSISLWGASYGMDVGSWVALYGIKL